MDLDLNEKIVNTDWIYFLERFKVFIAKSQSHKLFILPTIPENDEQMDQSRSEAAFHTTQVTLLGSGTE